MDAIRNSKIFRLSSTFLSLLNSCGNWVLTLIITFKLWMMCGCVRVIKLVCVWQMEFRTKWHYTKNAIILTTMKSIISNLLPSSMQCNMRLAYHALKIKANSSKMSFLPHGSSNKHPALVWKSGFEHLLFTLVFNLKFNLLKQLKAHTSWPNTLSHTFTRTWRYPHLHAWNLYCENVKCAKSLFFAYPTNQTIHSTQSIESNRQKDTKWRWQQQQSQQQKNCTELSE